MGRRMPGAAGIITHLHFPAAFFLPAAPRMRGRPLCQFIRIPCIICTSRRAFYACSTDFVTAFRAETVKKVRYFKPEKMKKV